MATKRTVDLAKRALAATTGTQILLMRCVSADDAVFEHQVAWVPKSRVEVGEELTIEGEKWIVAEVY